MYNTQYIIYNTPYKIFKTQFTIIHNIKYTTPCWFI